MEVGRPNIGLFCVLNSDGEVLICKLTKYLKFHTIENHFNKLNQRLVNQGKHVTEY